ncbi:MAG: hypothetical protein GW779_02300 [Candidatus Altiarchaeum hamiconexum]|uniref:K Homology domain-containing protein n=1 Tax=Candidatus Altarchaeum hamiconexum TaxID=1803513 RepID=A0A8J8CF77_9ARCH|nr:hypothetical protein [Candidatus Altarchaeum hamiconexum]OIQ04565.1 MAG: hypothetical protein AUK59_07330 [Candidatus Altarchaeum sp. CG2_30_32_3053]PIN67725.1 MAG: hypothetical protein COV98_01820 [Candidatus Altarchaeum sp. CG12_big_fil_rev_8_21_14_0_65_33_22]PIV28980.1 MAG: hypothetical protein COS36_00185 [Candidatus Altarchaeum sp. CG03_land_8_20_14_0_80_32_618]PIX49140.1 MAG: hypothetical protein COZ53_01545 [Candidatus Altarchaeum sp. CG_4_8_14_3_um_filter_33_2054]PIZ30382.1 MAG: hyp
MLPICNICAKTRTLCASCETKLKNEEISEMDVKIAQMIYDFGKGDLGFEKAVDVGDFVVVLSQKADIGKIIGPGGENLRKMEESIGMHIKIMGASSAEEMIHTLISPANIVSTSRLYKADGGIMKKITINKNDVDKLKMDLHSIKKIVSNLLHTDVEIVVE